MKRRAIRVTGKQAGEQLDALLCATLGVTSSDARRLVEAGAVYVDGRRCKLPHRALEAGQTVMAVLEETGQSALAEAPAPLPLRVLFEDTHLIAVDKPPGVTAQPTASRSGESLADLVSDRLGRPAGLVHRLDRQTSGVTVFGKTGAATSALAAEFREGRARKRYLAATGPGLPPRGEIDLPLSKDPSRPGRWRASKKANGIEALTLFERLFEGEGFCLVALFPRTGRTHQLRAHLTALGAPILGDALYGGAKAAGGIEAGRCLLHAQALAIRHPATSKEILVEAPLPEDLAAYFSLAGILSPRGPFS
ncbi:MAG: RluA family pseudouridine synthase [Myxococcaceae bacterium]